MGSEMCIRDSTKSSQSVSDGQKRVAPRHLKHSKKVTKSEQRRSGKTGHNSVPPVDLVHFQERQSTWMSVLGARTVSSQTEKLDKMLAACSDSDSDDEDVDQWFHSKKKTLTSRGVKISEVVRSGKTGPNRIPPADLKKYQDH